ncbi:MAG TPA: hypothetical protein VFA54_12625 [Bryobacterales bacterium]|nr:hypothetical protein [Bryobacterales bacterium]
MTFSRQAAGARRAATTFAVLFQIRKCVTQATAVLLCLAAVNAPLSGGALSSTARAIREEATRANNAAAGRPLPLAAHWNTHAFSPNYQLEKIESGGYVLLSFALPGPDAALTPAALAYYKAAIKRAAELKLPISLVGTNFASILYEPPYYLLPASQNPNVIQRDGAIRKQLDPMGPVEPWIDAGRRLVSSSLLQQIERWYPDPPLVVFVSNNEESRIAWTAIEQSKRFLDAYGPAHDGDFKRSVVAQGWIERYRALLQAMRGGLIAPAWRSHSIFIGYDAFGPPHYARWEQWDDYALPTGRFIDPAPLIWDGGSPSFYLHNWNASTDYNIWSPQGEALNWVFMLREAMRLNPRFWFGFSTWDGEQEKRDQLAKVAPFTPARYAAMVQFGLWLLRPRCVREFRGWTDSAEKAGPWLDAILEAVGSIHRNGALRRFWRRGELAPNRAWKHPYQSRPVERYAAEDRWFLLDTTLDPPRPYNAATPLPVFSLSLVLGRAPRREWLLYAHAPMGSRRNVGITIPGYRQVVVDVSAGGSYYLIRENRPSPERIEP